MVTSRAEAGSCHVLAPRPVLRRGDEWGESRLWGLVEDASAITVTVNYGSNLEHLRSANFMPSMAVSALHVSGHLLLMRTPIR